MFYLGLSEINPEVIAGVVSIRLSKFKKKFFMFDISKDYNCTYHFFLAATFIKKSQITFPLALYIL